MKNTTHNQHMILDENIVSQYKKALGIKKKSLCNAAFFKSLIPYLKSANTTRFYGGEPFLIPHYRTIFDLIKSLNPEMQVQIQSNGTIYTHEIENLFNELN